MAINASTIQSLTMDNISVVQFMEMGMEIMETIVSFNCPFFLSFFFDLLIRNSTLFFLFFQNLDK